MLPAVAAAVHAIAASLPAAAPVALAAAVGFGVVATHVPDPEVVTLKGIPEVAAECMKRSAVSHASALAAVSRALYGASSYSVVFKRGGVTGDPVMTAVLQESAGGSSLELRPIAGGNLDADAVLKMIQGCRIAPAQ